MQKSGFFNSSGGDRVYSATDFTAYFGRLVSNGIFYLSADNLKITAAATGLKVNAAAGTAWLNGYSYENTTPLELTLETASGVYARIDRVVLRLSMVERAVYLAVKTGSAVASPVPPELTRTSDVWELGLAEITVARGAVSITANAITDTRLDQTLCGLANSLVSAVYE